MAPYALRADLIDPPASAGATCPTLSLVSRSPDWVAPGLTRKTAAFLADRPQTPCLVVDLDVVEDNYRQLRTALPEAAVYYAVKANPAAPLVARLIALGGRFDTASLPEIDLCLGLGADPGHLSYGNTIKKARDIAAAHARGVDLFAFDAEEELRKIADNAPGSRVFCRILTDNTGAEWPLSRKFGCSPAMARDLMRLAGRLGLDPVGLSFHVGSQQTDPTQWHHALETCAGLFRDLRADGLSPSLVNLGGGLPTQYGRPVPEVGIYAEGIRAAVDRLFDGEAPRLAIEPGRGLVGNAGVLETEVVLVSRKDAGEERRWVYLDAGRFNGLAETEGEAIRYPITTDRDDDGAGTGPVVLAGPTCDSVDVLYDKAGIRLPLSLTAGDRLRLLSTGAYTTTYASVGFNGFAPLEAHYL
ncbi:type III PLP-dependent enzyme [Roseospira visakhapatnamensis]|uniref:ornithine decarboxylase n=1 Tax=Roseospira visakhapatnamensis TaxID=390880 RepID=A0A7W6RA10_9PROT|nr:type III PLP-dependent enzyme [Roseospira visakhapatnamensis]MBB4264701.1 ornithine decarboxylase [Roseospira visakhapatnamensis]